MLPTRLDPIEAGRIGADDPVQLMGDERPLVEQIGTVLDLAKARQRR